MKNFVSIVKEAVLLYCVIFTVGTLANSIGVLYLGIKSNPDVHGHIMLRAGLVLVITVVINLANILIKYLPLKGKMKDSSLLQYTFTCVIILLLIFIFIWALTSGYLWVRADELHTHAFRDLSRSVMIPAIVLAIIGFFIKLKKKSHKSDDN